jgi:hypothetical protein
VDAGHLKEVFQQLLGAGSAALLGKGLASLPPDRCKGCVAVGEGS